MPTFSRCRRDDGRVGVRNRVAVLPTSVAASAVAKRIAADAGPTVVATPHQMGTDQPEPARRRTKRVLVGIGRNPNVGGALVVELGTEAIDATAIADEIAANGTPTETVPIRDASADSRWVRSKTASSRRRSVSSAATVGHRRWRRPSRWCARSSIASSTSAVAC